MLVVLVTFIFYYNSKICYNDAKICYNIDKFAVKTVKRCVLPLLNQTIA